MLLLLIFCYVALGAVRDILVWGFGAVINRCGLSWVVAVCLLFCGDCACGG